MSSYAYLRVGDLVLTSTKNEVDPTVLMLFTEADKRIYEVQNSESDDATEDDTSDESFVAMEYAASLAVVKDRLEFMASLCQWLRKPSSKAFKNTSSNSIVGERTRVGHKIITYIASLTKRS